MKYDVVIESENSAVIERVDPDNELSEIYFVITFLGDGNIEFGRGTYNFRSMASLPRAYGDPRGYVVVGRPFHGKTAVKRAIEATSLEHACQKFFAEWGDSFRMMGKLQHV